MITDVACGMSINSSRSACMPTAAHQTEQPMLSRLAEPTDVQGKAPARGPPYFASRVLRQRFGEHATQLDMLD